MDTSTSLLLPSPIGTPQELEAALKATLHSLSLVLAYYASVNSLSAPQYAPHAPRQQTLQLQAQSAQFDAACTAIEQRLMRAIAVLQRDARKAAGQSPLIPTPPPRPSPEPIPSEPLLTELPTTEALFTDLSSTLPVDLSTVDLSLPPALSLPSDAPSASVADATGLDLSMDPFLNHSLFGDSANPSLAASPAGGTTMEFGAALTGDVSGTGGGDDLASIMALLANYPPSGADLNSSSLNLDSSDGVDGQGLSSIPLGADPYGGLDLSMFDDNVAGLSGIDGSLGEFGGEGSGLGGMDLSSLDFGTDPAMQDWMKGLGGNN